MDLVSEYLVRVSGTIGPAAREALADLRIDIEPTTTLLSGQLDQAALHGVIERIASLGLELVEVRRVTADGELSWP